MIARAGNGEIGEAPEFLGGFAGKTDKPMSIILQIGSALRRRYGCRPPRDKRRQRFNADEIQRADPHRV